MENSVIADMQPPWHVPRPRAADRGQGRYETAFQWGETFSTRRFHCVHCSAGGDTNLCTGSGAPSAGVQALSWKYVVEHVRGHRPRVEVRVKIVHLAVRRQLQLAFVVAPAPKYNQSQPKKQPKTNRNTHQPGALPSVADIPSPTTSLPLAMRSVPITAPPPMRGASSVHVMFRLALLRSGTGSGAGGAGCTAGGDVVMPA